MCELVVVVDTTYPALTHAVACVLRTNDQHEVFFSCSLDCSDFACDSFKGLPVSHKHIGVPLQFPLAEVNEAFYIICMILERVGQLSFSCTYTYKDES